MEAHLVGLISPKVILTVMQAAAGFYVVKALQGAIALYLARKNFEKATRLSIDTPVWYESPCGKLMRGRIKSISKFFIVIEVEEKKKGAKAEALVPLLDFHRRTWIVARS